MRTNERIPFSVLNEEWAQRNHYQSLKRLAERGGLDPTEALAIIEKRRWHKMDSEVALAAVLNHVAISAQTGALEASQRNGIAWAVAQWNDSVKHRPLENVHRRTHDDIWRSVTLYFGGDPEKLVGPDHDSLLAAKKRDANG